MRALNGLSPRFLAGFVGNANERKLAFYYARTNVRQVGAWKRKKGEEDAGVYAVEKTRTWVIALRLQASTTRLLF